MNDMKQAQRIAIEISKYHDSPVTSIMNLDRAEYDLATLVKDIMDETGRRFHPTMNEVLGDISHAAEVREIVLKRVLQMD